MESLRGMVSFVQTARSGSFVRAAQVLGISSVAVSRNVARLEAQLGLRLFARTTRQLQLTDEGGALLAQCEAPLEQLDLAFKRSRESSDAPAGRVRVTAVSPFVRAYLAPRLGDFHALYPQIELDIECSEQVTDLVAGKFDVGIRVGPLRDAAFVARPLGPLALVLCASPAFLARVAGPHNPADLARLHGLGLRRQGIAEPAPWRLQSARETFEVPVAGPLRCNDLLALMEACCGGLGVAQFPIVVALSALRAGRLHVLMPELAPQGLKLFLHYPDRQLPTRVRTFVEFVVQTMQTHPDLDTDPMQFVLPSVSNIGVQAARQAVAVKASSGEGAERATGSNSKAWVQACVRAASPLPARQRR